MKKNKLLTCNKCNWVHFGVSLEDALKQSAEFNRYWMTLSLEDRESYYGGSANDFTRYTKCMVCKNDFTDFRDAKDGDVPEGSTINPILFLG